MFEYIKNLFYKGGAKIGMIDELNSIADHQKIAVSNSDMNRIKNNLMHYRSDYPKVEYINSNNVRTEREFHSLNISKVLSRKMAKLVFNEGVDIAINDNDAADAFIQDVFQHSKFRKNFGEELEAGYAIGGLVLRPYFDTKSRRIKIAYTKPDAFFPLSSNSSDISEMAFSTVTVKTEANKKVFYTLLEFHEWESMNYVITNELYRSEDKSKLGVKVPLTHLEKYEKLKPRIVMSGFSRPLFVYIKLAGKNNKNVYSPLSLGIIDNSKQQIKDINEKYDQFMQEIKEGKRKILASEHFFKTFYDMNGRPNKQFSNDTSVFRMIRSDEPNISEFNPSLRTEEYINSINFLLRIIELQTGFSAGTFSFDGQSVKTATEIISENSETFATRSDNVLIVEEAMKELIVSIFELAAYHDLIDKVPRDLHIAIDFDDGVFQSQESKLDYYGKASTFGLIPKYKSIQNIFKVSEETAIEWVNAINREQMGMSPIEQQAQQDERQFGQKE